MNQSHKYDVYPVHVGPTRYAVCVVEMNVQDYPRMVLDPVTALVKVFEDRNEALEQCKQTALMLEAEAD